MNILYIDRNYVTSSGLLKIMLNLTKGISLVGHLPSFEKADAACKNHKNVDVLIFNTSSLDRQGIPFLRRVRKYYPRIQVYAMLDIYDRVLIEYLCQCSCICGVFSVQTELKDFHKFIQKPRHRDLVNFSSDLENQMYDVASRPSGNEYLPLLKRLSKREFDVLMMSIKGYRNKDIADRLNISPKTVCTHRCHIREKLCVQNMQQVYKLVLDIGRDTIGNRGNLSMLRHMGEADVPEMDSDRGRRSSDTRRATA